MERRSFKIEVGSLRAETRTVEASLSSEFPVLRREGEEVLSHKPGAIDLSRAPLPLLRAHDNSSLPVGVVENLSVVGGKLRGTIRLSANEDGLWKDIQDGILRNLSIGYQILERVKTKAGFIATKWLPYECSLVAAPADNTVGINRSINNNKERKIMDKNDVLKSKTAAISELAELAKSGENAERMEEVKGEIRSFDSRLEAFEMADAGRKDVKGFVPDVKKVDRSIIEMGGGPVANRSFAGMFNGGKPLDVDEEAIRAFRAQMVEGVFSSGGASVPEPLAAAWLDSSLESEVIRPRATVYSMESATRKAIGWDCKNQTGGSLFGGFSMQMLSETGTGTPQVGKLRVIELAAKKGGIFCEISNELSEDGMGIDAQIDNAIRLSIGYGLDNLFINGVGASEPLGLRNSPAKIVVAEETAQANDTIVYQNLVNMYARMYPAGRQRAVWIANSGTLTQLMGLTIGTASAYVPVMTESNGQFYIFGRPVLFNSHSPVLGDEDDIMFVDLSQYTIGVRRDLRIEKSTIPGWTQDLLSYRALIRFDGLCTWNTYLTPKNGSTMSCIVGLGERDT
ncbi:MAG: phage major capsid protein [Syntrophales bacterium]|nr:phage major capsid protein [Syntrophales bacterium]